MRWGNVRTWLATHEWLIHLVIVGLVFWWAFAFRFARPDFRNDDFDPLSKARQVLSGDLPGRDFYDDGRPLTIYASVLAQWISPTLLSELVLRTGLIALGVAFVYVLARSLTRSVTLGLLAALLTTAMRPRLYQYPKVLLFPLGLWLLWSYIDAPSRRRLAVLAAGTVVAFLFRHDYGLFLGVTCAVTLLVVHRSRAMIPLALFMGIGVLCSAPYFVWLYAQGELESTGAKGLSAITSIAGGILRPRLHLDLSRGLVYLPRHEAQIGIRWAADSSDDTRGAVEQRYRLRFVERLRGDRSFLYAMDYPSHEQVRAILREQSVEDTSGIDRARGELLETTWQKWQNWIPLLRLKPAPVFPTDDDVDSWIYYVFIPAVPLSVIVLCFIRPGVPHEYVKVLSLAALTAMLHQWLLQNDLDSRFPEVTTLTAVLLVWLMRAAFDGGRSLSGPWATSARWAIAAAVAVPLFLTGLAVQAYAATPLSSVLAAGFVRPATLARVSREVGQRPLDYWTSLDATPMTALTAYVSTCLSPDDRLLLVVNYEPEVFYLAERRFAGGLNQFNVIGFHPTSTQILKWLPRESVPLVIVDERFRSAFEREWPELSGYVNARYRRAATAGFGGQPRFEVWVDPERKPTGVDSRWELPCYRMAKQTVE